MDMGTALVVIAGIGAFYSLKSKGVSTGGAFGRKYRRGGEMPAEPAAALTSPREAELEREVDDLRTRIHVLERIATDGRGTRALADEIESLRGK